MRFCVHVAVLNGDDAVLALLDRLVDRLAEGVHRVDVPEADLLQDSRWYGQARSTRRKVLTSALASPPRSQAKHCGPHTKTISLTNLESAKRADKLAHAPLVILVEDREADGVLLDILVAELGWPELLQLWEASKRTTPRAVEIDTAGGKDAIPQRVQRLVQNAHEEERPPRVFVICDCDKRWPGDEEPSRVRPLLAVQSACASHDVPFHIWQKRSAENYIPDRVFQEAKDDLRNRRKSEHFNALLRRSKSQRDHFPVKDGLNPSERQAAINAGLYSPSEEDDLLLLEERLFPKRPRPLLLLEKERRKSFTAAGLRTRDGHGELDALLQAIAEEL